MPLPRRLTELSSFQAFKAPGFGALWTGALIANVGTWMSTVALGVAVTEQTGRAAWTGVVAALSFLPAVVLSPMAGALADRFNRRTYIAVLTAAQIAVAIALATLAFAGKLSVGWMAVLAFLNGCAGTLSYPGFVALIAELVPADWLHSALSLNSAQFNVGRIVGPALATVVFAVAGPAWAFAANALSFCAVYWALSRIPEGAPPATTRHPPLLRGIHEGFSVARGDPGIRLALAAVLLTAILVAPFIGLVPVFALEVFHGNAETASLFTTAQGVGAILGAFAMGPLVKRVGLRRLSVVASLLLGPCAAAYWLAPSPPVAAALIGVLGCTYLAMLTTLNTVAQLRAPRSAQARVSSIHSMLLGGGYAVGLVAMGALSDRFGFRAVPVAAAALFSAVIVTGAFAAKRSVAALEPTKRARGSEAAPPAAAAVPASAPVPVADTTSVTRPG